MSDNQISVSVGIVTYNNSNDIEKCLDTLFAHSNNPRIKLEVFVYDNQSSDLKITQGILTKQFPKVNLIASHKNKGFGYGHNKIIKQANSDYHLILNPDIKFTEDTISSLVDYLEKSSDIALITPEIRNTDGTIQHLPKLFPKFRYILSSTLPFFAKYRTEYTMSKKTITQPTDIEICTGCFMFAKTQKLRDIDGFDDSFFLYFEDFDLSVRMNKIGRIVYYPLTKVTHVWHRDTKKKVKPFLIQIHSMLKFYVKHIWRHG